MLTTRCDNLPPEHGSGPGPGTAPAIEETIEEFTDAGCREFMIFCNTAPAVGALDQLVSLPSVRRALGQPSGASR